MIQKINAYKSSDDVAHLTLSDAQEHEVAILYEECVEAQTAPSSNKEFIGNIAHFVVENKDQIIDILTMKPNSLPKARKINGGRKPRKHIAEQTTMFSSETPKPAA